jgi:hypothetical protein
MIVVRCTIEPVLTSKGQVIYPNLTDIRNEGATVVPGPFQLRFTERDDRLIV